ncbi:hypothetical protein ACRALDRAFT_213177 [Sodiomyces alcalophilus JCM 7366]|uniref:uncharacterized protein n=1 Tax=Sodiomyces alcalophilus JCM 7366 TaxID=591952 RepID=UPI0039B6A9EF
MLSLAPISGKEHYRKHPQLISSRNFLGLREVQLFKALQVNDKITDTMVLFLMIVGGKLEETGSDSIRTSGMSHPVDYKPSGRGGWASRTAELMCSESGLSVPIPNVLQHLYLDYPAFRFNGLEDVKTTKASKQIVHENSCLESSVSQKSSDPCYHMLSTGDLSPRLVTHKELIESIRCILATDLEELARLGGTCELRTSTPPAERTWASARPFWVAVPPSSLRSESEGTSPLHVTPPAKLIATGTLDTRGVLKSFVSYATLLLHLNSQSSLFSFNRDQSLLIPWIFIPTNSAEKYKTVFLLSSHPNDPSTHKGLDYCVVRLAVEL